MVLLGVNIDHVATVREARKSFMPDPVMAARMCETAGCASIVAHLREDRRHIRDADVAALRRSVRTRFNLEMSAAAPIVRIACGLKPDQATLVPEKREEITTEGGLDARGYLRKVAAVTRKLQRHGIPVSLFIDPVKAQIDAAVDCGARIVELHTGDYANAGSGKPRARELDALERATRYALDRGLEVNMGHGLDYENVAAVARIYGVHELNIGHSIVARAIYVGIGEAVREMLEIIR